MLHVTVNLICLLFSEYEASNEVLKVTKKKKNYPCLSAVIQNFQFLIKQNIKNFKITTFCFFWEFKMSYWYSNIEACS